MIKGSNSNKFKKKNPRLAASLSLFLGGLGHIYLGQSKRGLSIMVTAIISMIPGVITNAAIYHRKSLLERIKIKAKKNRAKKITTFIAIIGICPFINIVTVTILGMIDAYKLAQRKNKFEEIEPSKWFWEYEATITNWHISNIIETSRTEQPIGFDKRAIDNSSSSVLKRTLSVSKEYTKNYKIEYEKARTIGVIESVKIDKYLTRDKSIEDSFRETYGLSLEEKKIFREDIEIEVKPQTKICVFIYWKNIIQLGYIELCTTKEPKQKVQIPFRAIVNLTFDQAVKDNGFALTVDELIKRYEAGERDFRRLDLRNMDLSGINLKGANLTEAVLFQTNLAEADLTEANLKGAILTNASLRQVNFTRANLCAAIFSGMHPDDSSCTELHWSERLRLNLFNTDLTGAILIKAKLNGAIMNGINMSGVNLREANLSEAQLAGTNLIRADLCQANLYHTNLAYANLAEANLQSTEHLTCAVLLQTNLNNATFPSAMNYSLKRSVPEQTEN